LLLADARVNLLTQERRIPSHCRIDGLTHFPCSREVEIEPGALALLRDEREGEVEAALK
jgi:hypothetical protein